MKRAALVMLALASVPTFAADLIVGANLASWHSRSGSETWTPGLYLRTAAPLFIEAGAYRNSQGFASIHAGVGYLHSFGRVDAGIGIGAVSGYRDQQEWTYEDHSAPNFKTYGPPRIKPYVIPSVGFAIDERTTLRTFVIPKVRPEDQWCVSIAIELKLPIME